MNLGELQGIVGASGGGPFAQGYAQILLAKIERLEATNDYGGLFQQFRESKQQGDFRGRVLEINFADAFLSQSTLLRYGVSQGGGGDVDFLWQLPDADVFIEMKLLGQDLATKESINQQLEARGFSATGIADDTYDVARIQRDIFQKASPRKFACPPKLRCVNLVAIDVSELQLGTVDMGDCVLAATGNDEVAKYFDETYLRPEVVGVFEGKAPSNPTADRLEWMRRYHPDLHGAPHPCEYIHGVLFLFREPKERAALSYRLDGSVVWNRKLVDESAAKYVARSLREIILAPK